MELAHPRCCMLFYWAYSNTFRTYSSKYMGEESKMAEDINGLAQQYGKLLSHQSDRDLPQTNLAKGIQRGELMAKQYRGVLLIMAAVLRSTMGRRILMKRKRFGKEEGLKDWTLLVELLLEDRKSVV